jgi:hypothetical protein
MSKITVSELVDDTPIDVDSTVLLFAKAWHSTINAMFAMLELIQTHHNRPGFEKLCEALDKDNIIKRSVMSMLRSIIANPVLMEPKNRQLLPPSYNTLWTLTQIQEKVLEEKIAKKELSPNLTLESARTWRREQTAPMKKVSKRLAPVYATLKVESTSKLKVNSIKIQKCLEQLKKLGLLVEIKNPYK